MEIKFKISFKKNLNILFYLLTPIDFSKKKTPTIVPRRVTSPVSGGGCAGVGGRLYFRPNKCVSRAYRYGLECVKVVGVGSDILVTRSNGICELIGDCYFS